MKPSNLIIGSSSQIANYLPKEDFFKLIYQNRDVANAFMKLLSKEVKEKEERLLKLKRLGLNTERRIS